MKTFVVGVIALISLIIFYAIVVGITSLMTKNVEMSNYVAKIILWVEFYLSLAIIASLMHYFI